MKSIYVYCKYYPHNLLMHISTLGDLKDPFILHVTRVSHKKFIYNIWAALAISPIMIVTRKEQIHFIQIFPLMKNVLKKNKKLPSSPFYDRFFRPFFQFFFEMT